MPKRLSAFTLIELLVIVAIVGILTSVATIQYSSSRRNARDTRRKQDANAYGEAMQMYKLKNGTFFVVYKDSTASLWGCNVSEETEKTLASSSLPNPKTINQRQSGSPPTGYSNGCVGAYGRSYGPITADNTGAAAGFTGHSIASALRQGGFLTSEKNSLVDPNNPFLSHFLFRCDANGVITYGKNDQHYSLSIKLENPITADSTDQINSALYCATDHNKVIDSSISRYYQVNSKLFYVIGDAATPNPTP